MVQVGINIMGKGYIVTQWLWSILRDELSHIAVDRVSPIVRFVLDIGIVWFLYANCNLSILHLVQVAIDTLDMVEMPSLGLCLEAQQGHDSSTYVESSNGNCPLHRTDHRLVLLSILFIEEL